MVIRRIIQEVEVLEVVTTRKIQNTPNSCNGVNGVYRAICLGVAPADEASPQGHLGELGSGARG